MPDQKGPTRGAFLARAVDYFTARGITTERVITDNHWSYRRSADVAAVIAELPLVERKRVALQPHPCKPSGLPAVSHPQRSTMR
ncbi:hypothetical protein [Mycobacterium deserti]|uniref:Integrase catalytic domain-containing protein n=1 Tax=Mycobacterium deserti TaxID=2978347 RepID=A0ABT2M7V3_9MYCO|nr:hypothetical protein [Mycobacterium deserti]MCT7658016.1 hypothetical protein [Mycobacterium deserti]